MKRILNFTIFSVSMALTLPLEAATFPSNYFINDPTSLLNNFQQNLPITISINPGVLGLPNPQTYLQQLLQSLSQIQLTTPFSLGGGQGSLTGILQDIDFNEDPLLFDIAIDGQVILTNQGNNTFSEDVVLPFGLSDTYFRDSLTDLVKAGGLEGGLSETAQQKILDALNQALTTENDNKTKAIDSDSQAVDSDNLATSLDNLSSTNDILAGQSDQIAYFSQSTDTSFQLLRNIASQLGIQSRQEANSSTQFTKLGQILSNQSSQSAQQSQQLYSQQKTATQLLETAKQQQFLDSMQVVTQGEQLKLLAESTTKQNRLSQAPINQASTMSGVFLIPINQDY